MAIDAYPLPNADLIEILMPSLAPCPQLLGACAGKVRYDPGTGFVPRGWIGGSGSLADIPLVLITAEPGDPGTGELYPANDPGATLRGCNTVARRAMSTDDLRRGGRPAPFHRNLRRILDLFWPGTPLDEQLARTWVVPAVLCSASVSGGSVPRAVEKVCAEHYLRRQLDALPNAFVVALGAKAEARLKLMGRPADIAAQHPSARANTKPQETWRAAADVLHRMHA
jgi:hypothetical protein